LFYMFYFRVFTWWGTFTFHWFWSNILRFFKYFLIIKISFLRLRLGSTFQFW